MAQAKPLPVRQAVAALVAVSIGAAVLAEPIQRQPKSSAASIKGVKSKGGSKAPTPPNFKQDMAERNPQAISKSGAKPIHQIIKNPTAYYVYVWMDDEYICSISPYGTSTAWRTAGVHKLYAESAAGTISWGPKQVEFVPGQTFTWTLN